jgi:hypothetical protein
MAEIVVQGVSDKMKGQTGRPTSDLNGLNARVGNVESSLAEITSYYGCHILGNSI